MGFKKNSNPGVIQQKMFNDASGSQKNIDGGIVADLIFASVATATLIGANKDCFLTNTSGAVVYVKFGDGSVSIPTAADGIPILPNSRLTVGSGINEYIRSSAALHCVILAE